MPDMQKGNEPKTSRVGEIVSSDTCGPFSVSDIKVNVYFQVIPKQVNTFSKGNQKTGRFKMVPIFGCIAYTYILLQSRSRLDVTAKRGIFVGLSPGELALFNLRF
ncbi:hypothetical protein A3Q56_08668 [Intoshia linei]|uniref:Uncharacterized protein n=1 Tax=Intoshia linei TaxID=1819745 RepID=A0A177ANJ5_9BILA|nr:hypothetical protein A3Q56_08668 [Intoshia linei]